MWIGVSRPTQNFKYLFAVCVCAFLILPRSHIGVSLIYFLIVFGNKSVDRRSLDTRTSSSHWKRFSCLFFSFCHYFPWFSVVLSNWHNISVIVAIKLFRLLLFHARNEEPLTNVTEAIFARVPIIHRMVSRRVPLLLQQRVGVCVCVCMCSRVCVHNILISRI